MATIWTQVEEGPVADHESVRMSPPFGQLARRLQQRGFTPTEAANLLARCAGLPAARSGWTIRQVEHLVFIRTIVENGRLGG
jgi:hypothetical protein